MLCVGLAEDEVSENEDYICFKCKNKGGPAPYPKIPSIKKMKKLGILPQQAVKKMSVKPKKPKLPIVPEHGVPPFTGMLGMAGPHPLPRQHQPPLSGLDQLSQVASEQRLLVSDVGVSSTVSAPDRSIGIPEAVPYQPYTAAEVSGGSWAGDEDSVEILITEPPQQTRDSDSPATETEAPRASMAPSAFPAMDTEARDNTLQQRQDVQPETTMDVDTDDMPVPPTMSGDGISGDIVPVDVAMTSNTDTVPPTTTEDTAADDDIAIVAFEPGHSEEDMLL